VYVCVCMCGMRETARATRGGSYISGKAKANREGVVSKEQHEMAYVNEDERLLTNMNVITYKPDDISNARSLAVR